MPHPLAIELARRKNTTTALLVGIGSGRNLPPFLESNRHIIAVDESEMPISFLREQHLQNCTILQARYDALPLPNRSVDAVLSTHALQHGTMKKFSATITECARVCRSGAAIAFVAASTADARFGAGQMLEPQCFAPTSGDEQGVPHIYLKREQIYEQLARDFTIEQCEEVDADATVGIWAHSAPQGMRHFFITATRR